MNWLKSGVVTSAMASLACIVVACAAGDDGEVDGQLPSTNAATDDGGNATSGQPTAGGKDGASSSTTSGSADASKPAVPIYVATTGLDTATGSTPKDPLKSVATAIARASKCSGGPCAVLIAGGRYEEAIQIVDGVNLFGAYSPDFGARDRTRYATTITSKTNLTVVATNLTKATSIDSVTIEGADLSATDVQSSYAVFVQSAGKWLYLSHDTITGGKGGKGAVGGTGAPTACRTTPGVGGDASDCASNSGTSGDASGDPVVGGGGGGGGSNNCPSACPLVSSDGISGGGNGGPGGAGANGAGGAGAASPAGSFTNGLWISPAGLPGARGNHGTAGGGGGGGGTKKIRACFGCGTLLGGHGADGAEGGCGGPAGTAGTAGGGAFALVVDASQVTLEEVAIQGGVGGTGGAGGAGAAGTEGSKATDIGRTGSNSSRCGLINYSSGGGGAGGDGGNGGAGGGGAGGVGGPSIGLALLRSATVLRVGVVSTRPGTSGAGGAGGASNGYPGATGAAGISEAEHSF